MGYFREIPNLRYPSFLSDRKSSLEYVETKNLFRRIKLRDDLQNIVTVFDIVIVSSESLKGSLVVTVWTRIPVPLSRLCQDRHTGNLVTRKFYFNYHLVTYISLVKYSLNVYFRLVKFILGLLSSSRLSIVLCSVSFK